MGWFDYFIGYFFLMERDFVVLDYILIFLWLFFYNYVRYIIMFENKSLFYVY